MNPSRVTGAGVSWLMLALVILASLAIRARLLEVPLERDEGEYAYSAQLILEGARPYEQAYTMKFPGVPLAYLPFVAALGPEPVAVRASLLLVNAFSIFLVFVLTRRLFGAEAAVTAAAAYAVLALGRGPQGIYANTEHFVLLFALAGFAVLPWAREHRSTPGFLASGLLLGVCIVMKQHGAIFAALGAASLLGGRGGLPGARTPFPKLASFALGSLLPLVLLFAWMAGAGAWERFWLWTFEYSREYLGFVSPKQAPSFAIHGFLQAVSSAAPIWALALVGMASSLRRGDASPPRGFLWAFTLASTIALSLALRFRPHYFLFLLPAVAIWAALGARLLGTRLATTLPWLRTGVATAGVAAIALLTSVWTDADYLFEMTPEEVSIANFGANPFPEALSVGRRLRESSQRGDRIAVLASEPEIYFYAERRSATPFLYMTEVLRRSPRTPALQQELVSHLEADPPRYLVLSSNFNPFTPRAGFRRAPALQRWLREALPSAYRRTGLVEVRRDAPSTERWGPAATAPPTSPDWLMVYERREPGADLKPR